jgi:hypothetical protein
MLKIDDHRCIGEELRGLAELRVKPGKHLAVGWALQPQSDRG